MELAKRLLVGALTVALGAFTLWSVLAGLGWLGREVILYFGGNPLDWALNADLFGTGAGALGAGLLFAVGTTVAVVLLAGSLVVLTLNLIGTFVLNLLRPQVKTDRR